MYCLYTYENVDIFGWPPSHKEVLLINYSDSDSDKSPPGGKTGKLVAG